MTFRIVILTFGNIRYFFIGPQIKSGFGLTFTISRRIPV